MVEEKKQARVGVIVAIVLGVVLTVACFNFNSVVLTYGDFSLVMKGAVTGEVWDDSGVME